jgi:hypothetical protein
MTAPFKQPFADAGIGLSASPVTATAKAAGSNIAFIGTPSDALLLVRTCPGNRRFPPGGIVQNKSEALKL